MIRAKLGELYLKTALLSSLFKRNLPQLKQSDPKSLNLGLAFDANHKAMSFDF